MRASSISLKATDVRSRGRVAGGGNARLAGFRAAVEIAAANIREYARAATSARESVRTSPTAARLGQIVRPLESMGAYIPAGRYPLPSTLLMTVIPAQVAGVPNHLRRLPASQRGNSGCGVQCSGSTKVFRMGGAQAIAALAFGTATVPKVDRIVGPGNIYVAAAKKLLAGEVGIDFVAGPTEIVIIAAEGDPRYIAADMLAQAEHDVEASAILLTTSRALAEGSPRKSTRQLATLPTAAVAARGYRSNSASSSCLRMEAAPRPPTASRRNTSPFTTQYPAPDDPARGQHVHRTEQPGSRRRLRVRSQSRAAHRRRRPHPRRAVRGRLREGDFRAGTHAAGSSEAGAGRHDAGPRGRLGSACPLGRGAPMLLRDSIFRPEYCSRAKRASHGAVFAAHRRTRRTSCGWISTRTRWAAPAGDRVFARAAHRSALSVYPEYIEDRSANSATFFGVDPDDFILTNGTDEAIQVLINTYVDDDDEVLILRPSYAMYRFYAEVAGASVREIPYRAQKLAFPLEELLAAIRPRLRGRPDRQSEQSHRHRHIARGIERILEKAAMPRC